MHIYFPISNENYWNLTFLNPKESSGFPENIFILYFHIKFFDIKSVTIFVIHSNSKRFIVTMSFVDTSPRKLPWPFNINKTREYCLRNIFNVPVFFFLWHRHVVSSHNLYFYFRSLKSASFLFKKKNETYIRNTCINQRYVKWTRVALEQYVKVSNFSTSR